jgi:hypothetical protein
LVRNQTLLLVALFDPEPSADVASGFGSKYH